MNERPRNATLVVSSVATAAATGALVAIGNRLGNVGLPFNAIGSVLIHPVIGIPGRVVITGVLLHAVSVLAWSVICVNIATLISRRVLAAILAATAQFMVSWIVAWWSGNGLASVLPLGDRLVYAVVLASAMVVGMRFAFSPSRRTRPSAEAL